MQLAARADMSGRKLGVVGRWAMPRLLSVFLGVTLAPVACLHLQRPWPVPVQEVEIIGVYPHDGTAFTQGLIWVGGSFYESTGLFGKSALREVDLETGRILRQVALPGHLFGEGITAWGGHIVQLTWRSGLGLVFDRQSLRQVGEFEFEGEGWGLTNDGRVLIMSDGTHVLRFLRPDSFEVVRRLNVKTPEGILAGLNELEFVKGEILANVWRTERIARISPVTGHILGWIDLGSLLSQEEAATADVLNGIAYDSEMDRLFVTGKLWPKVFEVRARDDAGRTVGG